MHDEGIPDPAIKYEHMERDAIYLLTEPDRQPMLMTVEDIGRELETQDPMVVIRPLLGAGLLRRTSDDLVFASPAAFRMAQLTGHVV